VTTMPADGRLQVAAEAVAARLPELTPEKRELLWSDHIKAIVDTAPPLSERQKSDLRDLLVPGTHGEPTPRNRVPVPTLPPLPAAGRQPAHPRREPTPILAGVYFIRSGELIKIGMSADVCGRMAALRTMSPLPLELLAVASGGRPEEASLHQRFAHLRQHGEWFSAVPELLEFIADLSPATPIDSRRIS
jgi:hypothetical protein